MKLNLRKHKNNVRISFVSSNLIFLIIKLLGSLLSKIFLEIRVMTRFVFFIKLFAVPCDLDLLQSGWEMGRRFPWIFLTR